MTKAPRITFKKGAAYSGRMRLANTYSMNVGGIKFATIQQMGDKYGPSVDIWFWYGMGRNTSHSPVSLEEAKKEVKEYYLANKDKLTDKGDVIK